MWFAENPSKRWAEKFFLCYSPCWIIALLCIVVPFQFYEVRTGRGDSMFTCIQDAGTAFL